MKIVRTFRYSDYFETTIYTFTDIDGTVTVTSDKTGPRNPPHTSPVPTTIDAFAARLFSHGLGARYEEITPGA